jgi:hypothetical protein
MKPNSQRVRAAQAAIADLYSADRTLREDHAAALRERDRVAALPPPVDDVVANMRGLVDELAASWSANHRESVIGHCGGSYELENSGLEMKTRQPQLPWTLFPIEGPRLRDLCGLFPEMIKNRLEDIIRAQPIESGTSLSARPAAVAAVDARISAIEDEHTELCDTAAAFAPPIHLELLAPVRARREKARLIEEERVRIEAAHEEWKRTRRAAGSTRIEDVRTP